LEDILGIAPIGITDNFFELGGHSLLVMRLIAQINEKFGKNMPIATLFDAPTLEQLANLLNQEEDSEPWRSLVAIQTNGSKPPFFCVHEIIGNAIYCQRMARYLPDQPLYGLQTLGLDGKQAPFRCIEDMATHYINEVKTIQPNGPYFLGGYSFGGYVAYEMAQQLQAQGEKVALLTLFDSSTKDYYKRLPLRWFLYQVNQISRHGLGFILDKVKAKVQANWSKDNVKKAEIKESEDWVNADLSKLIQSLKLDTNKLMDRSIEQVTVANWQAMEDYVPQFYQGKVTLFRAILERSAQGWYLDPQLGWGNLVPELDVQEISSIHINMFDEPQVKQVAEKLKVCLDKAQAGSAVVEMQAVKPKVLD
jgi:thioesterase domain-containing protein/acyl carrier protein